MLTADWRYRAFVKRNRYVGFLSATHHGFVVVFDMFWNVLDAKAVDPGMGAQRALESCVDQLASQGWALDCTPRYGFVFMSRESKRILIEVTPRDPNRRGLQAFSPFRTQDI
ncbi:MAG TPA: hypothetical protein VGI93_02040 [Steroidobacteraceae bacterium]|jgi:hypothetical protein